MIDFVFEIIANLLGTIMCNCVPVALFSVYGIIGFSEHEGTVNSLGLIASVGLLILSVAAVAVSMAILFLMAFVGVFV